MNWYFVQAYSGFENKVADNIKDVMDKNSLQSSLGEVLVPTHKVTEVKKGKRSRVLFYVFLAHREQGKHQLVNQLLNLWVESLFVYL